MQKKIFLLFTVLTAALLFGPRLFILSIATREYYMTNDICLGRHPVPPTELAEPVPIYIYEVKPYAVMTDRGHMYPGDEYETWGEVDWFGMATLLWAGRDGAVFVVTYDIEDPELGYSRPSCRWFVPVGDYR